GISPAQGARALRRLLATDLGPQVAVTPVGIDAVLARIRSSAQSPDGRSPTAQEATVDGPPPPDAEAAVGSDQAPPRNELEQKLVQVWKDVLGVDHVGVDDDFFELGGNSLVAVQLIASIRKVVKVKLPMRSLFDTPTVAGLASRIEDLLAEQRHTSGSGEAKIRRLRRD
ncbi:MAG TPA: phosphopantetheine-binding protein, partial [Actinopolymorphaceae bacterium]